MKILITVHQFFPDYTAGTEVLTLSVARELLSRGHNVRIYTGYPTNKRLLDHERFDEYQFEGIHVYRFHHAYEPMGGQTSLIEVGYDNFVAANYFERIVNDFKPDVVHFFHLNRLGTRLIDKANLLGVPTFMTFTDFWPICPTGQLLLPSGKLCIGPNQYASNCVRHLAQSTQKGVSGKIAGWVPLVFVNMLTKIATLDCCSESKGLGEIKAISMRLETNLARLNCLKKIIAPNKMMRKLLI